jgi:predicted nuclease with TOPRIM domain
MNTPDFSTVATRQLDAELVRVDLAIFSINAARAVLNQLAGVSHTDDVSDTMDDLNGLLSDLQSDHLTSLRGAINEELDRRDAALDAAHERTERAYVRS